MVEAMHIKPPYLDRGVYYYDVDEAHRALEEILHDSWLKPGPVRTLQDMTEPEIVALENKYGCPVIRENRNDQPNT